MKALGALPLTSLLLIYSSVVCGELSVPQNVRLHTLNTNYVLKWDWNPNQELENTCNITFTAQSLHNFKASRPEHLQKWTSVCLSTPKHYCDFSSVPLNYLGVFILRVRSQCGQNASSWFQIEFCPDKDAVLGPPSAVNVTTEKGMLQIAIIDPLTHTNVSMKTLIKNIYYNIQYWKKDFHLQKSTLKSTNNLVILSDVEKRTEYCVRVRSGETYYNKTSVYSPIYCIYIDGPIPEWQIVLCFLASVVICFFLVLTLSTCHLSLFKLLKNTFYPSVPLPMQYLHDKEDSDMPHLLSMQSDAEICCDKIEVLKPDPAIAEIFNTMLEVHAQPSTSECGGMGSRQNSRDSGVYSTGDSSGLRSNVHLEIKIDKTGDKNVDGEQDEGVLQDILV